MFAKSFTICKAVMQRVEEKKREKLYGFKIYFLWFIVLVLAVYFFIFVSNIAGSQTHGFPTYFTASKLLSNGEDVSRFYDNEWFSAEVKKHAPKVYEIYHVNLPTTAFLFLPLSVFNYSTAKIIWTIFSLLILIYTIGFLLNEFKFPKIWLPLILILLFAFQPLYANFLYGQAYVFIFCLLVMGWYAYKNDKRLLLGFTIGIIFIIKSTSLIFFLFLLIQKRWKSFISAVMTVLLIIFATIPWIGIDAWYAFSEKFVNYISHPSLSVTAYQTLHSFFHHFTVFNPQWNPEPIFNIPALGKILSTLSILLVLIFSSVKAYKLKKSDLAFGLFLTAGLIISPASLDYHYTIILFSVLIMLKWIIENPGLIIWTALTASVILIAAYIPYTSAKVADGWLSIFAYPKLYGAVILWGLFLFAVGKNYAEKVRNENLH